MMRPSIFLVACLLQFGNVSEADESIWVYGADAKNKQILCVSVTESHGNVSAKIHEPLQLSFGPSSITASPNANLVVASGSTPSADGSIIASIKANRSGSLQLVDTTESKLPTGYSSFDRSGRFFLFVNYRNGNLGVHRVNHEGRVSEQASEFKTTRREAHCILTTPDNRFTYVPCVKENNALYQYAFDEESGALTPLDPFDAKPPAMFGPRHVAYHPSLPIAYFSNEQQLGVSVFSIASNGQLTDKQHAVTRERRSPYVTGERGLHASDLAISRDGTRLFVAVRDFVDNEDSIYTFRVESDGRLSQIADSKVGDIPWKIDVSQSGDLLLVSETADRRLSIYQIETDGNLSKAAEIGWNAAIRDMVIIE